MDTHSCQCTHYNRSSQQDTVKRVQGNRPRRYIRLFARTSWQILRDFHPFCFILNSELWHGVDAAGGVNVITSVAFCWTHWPDNLSVPLLRNDIERRCWQNSSMQNIGKICIRLVGCIIPLKGLLLRQRLFNSAKLTVDV